MNLGGAGSGDEPPIENEASATSIVQKPSVECCASRTGPPEAPASQPVSFHPEIPRNLNGVVRNARARSNHESAFCGSRESFAMVPAESQTGLTSFSGAFRAIAWCQ